MTSAPDLLVTVGTDHHPFGRLLEWVHDWSSAHPDVSLLAQSGASPVPAGLPARPFLGPDELRTLIAQASVVICHGGPGTIAECHHAGRRPVVVPREHARGEHVDDHQVRFTERLDAADQIHRATTREELYRLLDRSLRDPEAFRMPTDVADLEQAVATFGRLVADAPERRPSRRARPRALQAASLPDVHILFIAGWGRSGSTLLARLLGSVPGVTTVGELRDLVQHGIVENRRCGCGEPFHSCPQWLAVGQHAFGGWANVDVPDLLRLRAQLDRPWWLPALASGIIPAARRSDVDVLAGFLRALYRGIHAVTGADLIVDSSKAASYGLLLEAAMPGSVRVAHLVRDPRGVVHSWDKRVDLPDRPDRSLQMIRYGALAAAVRYDLYNTAVTASPSLRRTAMRLRYEDLVLRPAAEVARLLRHAGVPPRPGALAHLRDPACLELGSDHTVDGNPMRFTTGTLVLRDDQAWRTELSPARRRVVDLVTAPLMASYGYDHTAARSPGAAPPPPAATGTSRRV